MTVNHNTGVSAAVSRQNENNASNDDNNDKVVSIVSLLLNKKIKDRSDWVQTESIWRI
jgi:hypothetical protein